MAFCVNCGSKMEDGARFCSSCGTQSGGPAPVKAASEKVGNVRKCPSCGEEVPAMKAICPSCRYEFSNVKANTAVKDFFEKLDAISEEIFKVKAAEEAKGPLGGAWGVFIGLDRMANRAKAFMGPSASVRRYIEIVETFPIPNAKEDIIEFIFLATSRYKGVRRPLLPNAHKMEAYKLDNVWRTKCEQAYSKAKMLFSSDKATVVEIENLLKRKKKLKKLIA